MGSFPYDIELRFDQSSAMKKAKELANNLKKMMKDVEAGVEGSSEKMQKSLEDVARSVVTSTTRAGKQLENMLRGVERSADSLGKSAGEKSVAALGRLIKEVDGNADAVLRLTAAKQKYVEYEKQQAAKALDDEIKALEKRASLYGKSGIERMQADLSEQIKLLNGNTEAIKRTTAAYEQMIAAEKQEAAVAREREIQGVQRRGAMAGMTPAGRMQFAQGEELARLGGDPRVAAAHEQELAAAAKEATAAIEKEIQALEKRGELIGKNAEERIEIARARDKERLGSDPRVDAYYDKERLDLRQKETQAIEKETQALERQAKLTGKTGSARAKLDLEEDIKLRKLDTETIKRRTVAIEEMALAEKTTHNNWSLVARGVRDIFEGRMTYGAMDIGRAMVNTAGGGGAEGAAGAVAGIGMPTLAAGGTLAALGAFEAVGYKAAKSMGEFARSIREVQGTTGMSVREVQQLQIAARLSGRSFEDITQAMRGFTQALEGQGPTAAKAAKDLEKMGVNLTGLRYGTVSAYEAFEQMGEALRKNPDVFQNNIEMMDILKRSGLADTQMFKELAHAAELAKGVHIWSDDELKQMDEMREKTEKISIQFDNIWNRLKMLTAQVWVVSIEYVTKGPISDFNTKVLGASAGIAAGALSLFPPPPPGMPGQEPGTDWMRLRTGVIDQMIAGSSAAFGRDVLGDKTSPLEAAQRKVQELERTSTELHADTKENRAAFLSNSAGYLAHMHEVTRELEQQRALIKSINELEAARKSIAEELVRIPVDVEDRLMHPDELPSEARLRKFKLETLKLPPGEAAKALATATPYFKQLIDREDADRAAKLTEQRLEQSQTFAREMGHIQAGGVAPVDIREMGQRGVTRADVERDITDQYRQRIASEEKSYAMEEGLIQDRRVAARDDEQRKAVELAEDQNAYNLRKSVEESTMQMDNERRAANKRERDLEIEHAENMSRIQLSDQEEGIKHAADLARKSAELRFKGDSPAAGIAEEYRISVELAQELYDNEIKRIALHETGYKAEEDAAIALHKLHREDEAASEEAQFKLMEMQQKQLDTLKGKIEPLYHTLFTDPKNFGKQLRSTVTEAALHPIVSGLSEMTSRALYPTIYGATGTGGIAGAMSNLFGIKPVNNTIPVTVMNLPGGGGGGVTSSYSPGGGYWGGGGTGGGGGGGGGLFGNFGAAGGTTGSTIMDLPFRSYGGDMLAATLGGFGGTGGAGRSFGGFGSGTVAGSRGGLNLSGLKALKGSFMPESYTGLGGEKIFTGAGSTFGENLGGALSSQAAAQLYLGAGMPLAMAGITGTRRGTAGGTVESMLGGAGVGAGIGTMILPGLGTAIGAGVGAAAGLGIGIGEMIAGVESQRNEAKRLVQSVYHIGINNTTADQIVSMANQTYGGSVSVAVRSPDVRRMLGLYAAGTGQANTFTMGSGDPHGASLVESGGVLSQQATYQYGQAYSQSSNLPVYGGQPTHVLGAPGGGMSLSLNIAGTDAAKFLTGNVVTPDVVQTQYAAAMNNSSGRVAQALMMSEPGSIQA